MSTMVKNKTKPLVFVIVGVVAFFVFLASAIAFTSWRTDRAIHTLYMQGQAYYQAGDYENAIYALQEANAVAHRTETYLLLAEIYETQNNVEKAIEVLYLGSYQLGDGRIEQRLRALKEKQSTVSVEEKKLQFAGEELSLDVKSLSLSEKRLTNISPLAQLEQLETLILSENGIRDVKPLSGLVSLAYLDLQKNAVADLTPLAQLQSLSELYLDGNPITDLSPLYQLTQLKKLSIRGLEITLKDYDALQKALPDCEILWDIDENTPYEITLGEVTFLTTDKEIDLSNQDISDIHLLAYCTKVERLNLGANQIADITPLQGLTNLTWLSLWGNQITDISPLAHMKKLSSLDLNMNDVSDLTPLQGLTALEEVYLNYNGGFASLSPLGTLSKLKYLGLQQNKLSDADVEILKTMTNLQVLQLEGNSKISAAQIDFMRQALPYCQISYGALPIQ